MAKQLCEREDWQEFRTFEGLHRKGGVRREILPRLVVKELVDNSLDAGAQFQAGRTGDGGIFIEDDGPGLNGTNEEIAQLCSIKRPLRSSKHLRLPARGALGNGLRVVTGAVLASQGTMVVATKGRSLKLKPLDDGTTKILSSTPWSGKGMRIELRFGSRLDTEDEDLFTWAEIARMLAGRGSTYKGNSSSWWYGMETFWSMLQSHGEQSVRSVIEQLDGCSGRRANEVAGEYAGRAANSLSRYDAGELLERAREQSSPVAPRRLGKVGKLLGYLGYARDDKTTFDLDGATIPVVIEVWSNVSEEPSAILCVNRTPVATELTVNRSAKAKTKYFIAGCGLSGRFDAVMGKDFTFLINVECPVIPLASDVKTPDLKLIENAILIVLKTAAKQASRNHLAAKKTDAPRASKKDFYLGILDQAIAWASGDGKTRYNQRQLFYAARPHFIEKFGEEPKWKTFCKIITEYEAQLGKDLPGIYRDTRGVLYHPHTGEEIPLGTLAVENYKRPDWTFHKVLYCEKEGFFPLLKDAQWPERNDCALLTSIGFATRAVCDVLDLLGEGDEPITFYCIHDADGPGTVIYDAMQEGAQARPKRRSVEIINLGLDPAEALEMGLPVESVDRGENKDGTPKAVPVGGYLDEEWKLWLQSHRSELNGMSSIRFLEWLDRKMEPHNKGKLVPPVGVMTEYLTQSLREEVENTIRKQILHRAGFSRQVEKAMSELIPVVNNYKDTLTESVNEYLVAAPTDSWREPVSQRAVEIVKQLPPSDT